MNVKQLILHLEKIPNKYLEVKFMKNYKLHDVDYIIVGVKYITLRVDNEKDE